MRKPSPAVAISTAALFFSLGGASMAASHYVITSTSQIKPTVLRQLQGRVGPQGATGAQGQAGAQGAAGSRGDVGAQGAAGTQGMQGTQGAQGAEGPAGSDGDTNVTPFTETSSETTIQPGGTAFLTALCPGSFQPVGGGYDSDGPGLSVSINAPGHGTWEVQVTNTTSLAIIAEAWAVCD